jgi:hypothetical protein
MPADDLPIGPDRLPDAPHEKTPIAARERRETEQLITDWKRETRQLGHALALMALDVSAMTGPKWAHRFIIAVDPVVEASSLLFSGARFASLLGLPERPNHSIPIFVQLPTQYIPVFTRGCITSTLSSSAVRMQGAVERENGGQEFYRAAFISLSLDGNRRQHLVLGAFNCRVAEPAKV